MDNILTNVMAEEVAKAIHMSPVTAEHAFYAIAKLPRVRWIKNAGVKKIGVITLQGERKGEKNDH